MKKKIEAILYNCSEEVFLNLGESTNCVDRELAANAILSILPKPRYPDKDGWPDAELECLFLLINNEITTCKLGYFDCLMERKDIKWWMPKDEFLGLVEGE